MSSTCDDQPDHKATQEMASDFNDLIGEFVDLAQGIVEDAEPEEIEKKWTQNEVDVWLTGIEFHWDGSTIYDSGIPLHPIDRGWIPDPRSTVAYTIGTTKETVDKGEFQIMARFYTNGGKGKIQVRNRSIEIDVVDLLTHMIQDRFEGQNALGTVAEKTVFFSESGFSVYRGKYTYVPLSLENVKFPELGVGIYDINWRWEYRKQDLKASEEQGKTVWEDEWHIIRTAPNQAPMLASAPFQITKHRVYVTLDEPSHPWSSCHYPDLSQTLPISMPVWSYGLDIACRWAKGARNKDEAAKMIADKLYASGKFEYHPEPNYSFVDTAKKKGYKKKKQVEVTGPKVAYFHLDKMLERLFGGQGLGEKANCFDLALGVASLANMLGCRLMTGKLQNLADTDATDAEHYEDNKFEINPICAIGMTDKEEEISGVNYDEGSFFSYHTVAWAAAHGELGFADDFSDPECTIYDASLEFMTNGKQVSASGLKLGDGKTAQTYIQMLAADTPMGRARCNPQPVTVYEIQVSG